MRVGSVGVIVPVMGLLGEGAGRAQGGEPNEAKQACVTAAEQGQTLRDEGKYRAARASFLACAQQSCPRVVAETCTQWLREIDKNAPSIVLAVSDDRGQDLTEVRVTFDSQALIDHLDGQPIPVDAGAHVLHFSSKGMVDGEEKVLIRAGEQARVISVRLRSPAEVTMPTDRMAPPLRAEPVLSPHHVVAGSLTVAALAAVTAGIVLAIHSGSEQSSADNFRAQLPSMTECYSAPVSYAQTCTALADAVSSQHNAMNSAEAFFLAGGGLAVGAVVAWFAWPRSGEGTPRATGALQVIPGGMALRASLDF
jgi:hypothetical protein